MSPRIPGVRLDMHSATPSTPIFIQPAPPDGTEFPLSVDAADYLVDLIHAGHRRFAKYGSTGFVLDSKRADAVMFTDEQAEKLASRLELVIRLARTHG